MLRGLTGWWRERRASGLLAIIGIVWNVDKRLFSAFLGIQVAMALLPLSQIWASAQLIDVLASAAMAGPGAMPRFWQAVGVLAAASLLLHIGNRVVAVLSGLVATRARHACQATVGRHAASVDLQNFDDPEFLDLMQQASDAGGRPASVVLKTVQVASGAVGLFGLVAVLAGWPLWLLALLIAPPIIAFRLGVGVSRERVATNLSRTRDERRASYLRALFVSHAPAKEMRLFGLAERFSAHLDAICSRIYADEWRLGKRDVLLVGLMGALCTLNAPLIVAYFGIHVFSGQMGLGEFSLYTQAAIAFNSGITRMLNSWRELSENAQFVRKFFGFLTVKPVIEARRSASILPPSKHFSLELKGVSFRYPNSCRQVLEDVSFVIEPGEVVCLAGSNGSGKSTIVKLVTGLYEPDAGTILLGGVDIRRLDRQELRRRIGMVLQDYCIYDLTLAENIALGNVITASTAAEIRQAGAVAGLDEIARSLPFGYDTLIGRGFDAGHELSGGQKQLVAHARCLMRDSGLLILDEPTAALDARRDDAFISAVSMRALERGNGVLIVSHSAATQARAGKVVWLSEGRVLRIERSGAGNREIPSPSRYE